MSVAKPGKTDLVEPLIRRNSAIDLICECARALFENGLTTEGMLRSSAELAGALRFKANVFPTWGQLFVRVEEEVQTHTEVVAATPTRIDMSKVTATMSVIDQVHEGKITVPEANSLLAKISGSVSVSLIRFALMAAAGAAALGVIFGADDPVSLVLIVVSAGLGACLRRWLGAKHYNLFFQPFSAALLAGIVGGIAFRLQPVLPLRLIAGAPCLILVPGAHILNGALDLSRTRIVLALARIAYSIVIIISISFGLWVGLVLCGVSIPLATATPPVPFFYDVVAAGVAAASFATALAMPWRMLPTTILIGMIVHSARWLTIAKGLDPAAAALIACLIAGVITTPVADWLRLPFAGIGFASVVSLIPGAIVLRLAGSLIVLVRLGLNAPVELSSRVVADFTTAVLVLVAMALGLIAPKILIGRFTESWLLPAKLSGDDYRRNDE